MKNLKRFCLGIVILAIALLLPGCGGTESPERDPATFDEFADSIFQLVLSGDELSSNYLFEDPTMKFSNVYSAACSFSGLITPENFFSPVE